MKSFVQLAVFATGVLASPFMARDAPVLPSADPFYSSPSNIGTYKAGQVIATRDLPPSSFNGMTNQPIKRFLQVKYRTNDAYNKAVASVATILVPANANSNQLLAYQTAYDSANNNCSPSYSLQNNANNSAVADIGVLGAVLNKGINVVTSDYEGLLAEFTVGQQSGHATLDSIRATFNLASNIGLSKNALYAMWGYSGGALASEWAAELAATYAPELKIQGTALGGLTPNVTSVLFDINKSTFAGLAFSGITGIVRAVPEARQLFSEQIIPAKQQDFANIAAGCLIQTALEGAGKDLYSYFKDGQAAVLDPRFTGAANKVGIMGYAGTPNMPLYAYKATGDEISPVNDTDKLVSQLCNKGVNVEYHRDQGGDHLSELVTGVSDAFNWIQDRLAGKPVTNVGCTTIPATSSTTGISFPSAFSPQIQASMMKMLATLSQGKAMSS